jgi:hypothetical protein
MNEEPNDNQMRLKEELIKEEIEKKNFQKDMFLKFIAEQKENGGDLSNWSILDLNTQISNLFFKSSTEIIS